MIAFALFVAVTVSINVGAGVWNLADGRPIGALNLGLAAFLLTFPLFVVLTKD